MEKVYYVIRKSWSRGEIETVFSGTLEEALEIQKYEGVDEEDYVTYDSFEELMEEKYFGTDSFDYKLVNKKDYIKVGKYTTLDEEKNKIWEKY